MHESLNPDLAGRLAEPMPAPPVAIFDAHMHSGDPSATAAYVSAARAYGVDGACNLASDGLADPMRHAFGNFFIPSAWPRVHRDGDPPTDWGRFRERWVDRFEHLLGRGMRSMKFKLAPWPDRPRQIWLDDDRLAPLLALCATHGVLVQLHAAHPTCWWPKRFDPAGHRPKSDYLDQLRRVMDAHPALTVLSVHMGSNPEDLDYLQQMMECYDGYHIDTSATKWVVRELSAQVERAREFFIRFADRICFGSDLVVQRGIAGDYYTSRFHVQRTMWETDTRTFSMIHDPDAPPDGPRLCGLALPANALAKIYRGNILRLLRRE